jgi:hypothetical protein
MINAGHNNKAAGDTPCTPFVITYRVGGAEARHFQLELAASIAKAETQFKEWSAGQCNLLDVTLCGTVPAWQHMLKVGDAVFWEDPADSAAIQRTMDFHQMSREAWDNTQEGVKEDLATAAEECYPTSSGWYRIERINSESGRIEDSDTVVSLVSDEGSEAEVIPQELK